MSCHVIPCVYACHHALVNQLMTRVFKHSAFDVKTKLLFWRRIRWLCIQSHWHCRLKTFMGRIEKQLSNCQEHTTNTSKAPLRPPSAGTAADGAVKLAALIHCSGQKRLPTSSAYLSLKRLRSMGRLQTQHNALE